MTSKKRKYPDAETVRAVAVAEAAERAERGDARSEVVIADSLPPGAIEGIERVERLHGGSPRTIMVAGRRLTLEESQPYGESQQ